ncbi:toll/interleukin-1 receptor domain-containing protein [Segetibacter aerophilus]|uniref:TIR domain-containing protein n=1 Tax=Segetibacter aerophilus TaxID=670293 RepID=A0A512B6Y5_9BACT|nr:toll/interleukin-1 receptor domain-containing protein [Segetibacter aerophilus]GEO07716.1 hypothetical protein SAE01_02120 [Segetibacter aerophilus]
MNSDKIFFSYSRTDASDFSLRLALDLKKEGFNIWIDQKDIRAGSEWDLEIEKALETCDCLLFVQSTKSVTSANVLNEVYYALDQNKRVIPLPIHTCKTPFRIKRLNYIDFTSDYDAGLAMLINELRSEPIEDIHEHQEEDKFKRFSKLLFSKTSKIVMSVFLLVIISVFFYTKTKKPVSRSNEEIKNTLENFAGNYTLVDVKPDARLKRGYLKIEKAEEKKVKIRTNFQFYYFRTNDTAFFDILNGFAECASCELKDEMRFADKRIDIGANRYRISKIAERGKKLGDTTFSAGYNSAIPASVILHIIDRDTLNIKVTLSVSTPISGDFVVDPFIYTFTFKRNDD